MARATTLNDIARETGLSLTAVSLVLNGRPNKISEKSRAQILEAAQRLSYQTRARKAGAARPPKLLGLIIPVKRNLFYYTMLEGIEHCARAKGYRIVIGYSGGIPQSEYDAIQDMIDSGVDGIIFAAVTDKLPDNITVPAVLVGHYFLAHSDSCVTTNNEKGAYLITRYLIEQGHRRIACITARFTAHNRPNERLVGYCRALEEAGMPFDESYVFSGDFTIESGYAIAGDILGAGAQFDAVFCNNDYMAFGLLKRARELGVRVPGDISVAGYDDVDFAALSDPPLTTVRQPAYELGIRAATQLFSEIENPATPHQAVYFEPELILRESVRRLGAPSPASKTRHFT